jgi:hypothetical protein
VLKRELICCIIPLFKETWHAPWFLDGCIIFFYRGPLVTRQESAFNTITGRTVQDGGCHTLLSIHAHRRDNMTARASSVVLLGEIKVKFRVSHQGLYKNVSLSI